MRTTLEIPQELIEEARDILGFKSKTDTVVVALREIIRRKRLEDLKEMAGKIPNMVDVRALDRKRAKR